MPTYDYRCPACDHRFELFQRMNDTPGAPCPACGAAAERQLSAGAGFLFKGDGFYITDYRSDDYRKKAAAESGKGGEAAKSGESKGDTKGDTKGDAKGGDSGTGSGGGTKSADPGGRAGGGSSTPSGPSSPTPAGG